MIAVTMPGMIGDALWAIPAARALAERHGCPVDFWTSYVVRPAADLIRAQDFIHAVIVDDDYRIERGDCGVQPWRMSNAESPECGYEKVYHLGFRETPDVPIPEYCCRLAELPQQPNRFDIPPGYAGRTLPDGPFVALAAKGQNAFTEMFRDFVGRCPLPVVEVGRPGEAVATQIARTLMSPGDPMIEGSLDRTSSGFLEMAWVISKCKYFVGIMSAPLVVASGFPCFKIAPHYDGHWDMRHVIQTPLHAYPEGRDANLILEHIR